MPRASKRIKTSATGNTEVQSAASTSNTNAHVESNVPQHAVIPFNPGSSLERVPDDVLHEIISFLPTLNEIDVLRGPDRDPPAILSDKLVRTPTLRALSKTSRLLRSRCLVLAWKRIELCGVTLHNNNFTFFRPIGEATKVATRGLNECSHLRPMIQTITVILTRYQHAEILPAFAQCLTLLPNLTTIEVVHAHSQMTTMIKTGFEGKRFPSVRKIILPSCAHEILKSCPNVEDVICTEDSGSTIVGSIIKGKCNQVRVLKGVYAPIKRLVKFLPNLNYITVHDISTDIPLADFPLLDTIEIDASRFAQNVPLVELVPGTVKEACRILRENKSQADKFVKVTRWTRNMDLSVPRHLWEWSFTSETVKV